MDSISRIFSDRINRMYRIFSRFSEETVKVPSAYWRKTFNNTFHTRFEGFAVTKES
jgi:hypothetical protein